VFVERFIPLIGLVSFVALAWVLSEKKKLFPWRMLFWGCGLQFIFAVLILGVPALGVPGVLSFLFTFLNTTISKLLSFSDQGASFLFGSLMSQDSHGYVFAFRALPTILFFSSLVAIFYHLGILQRLVGMVGRVMQKTMKTSGAESLSASANIFVGQTEAPLLVKPFLANMTRSELFAVMVAGMATVAGGVLAAYVGLLQGSLPNIAGHLVTASVMSAPAALLMAKVMVPETEQPQTAGDNADKASLSVERSDKNVIEAAARGASEGLSLALNVAAMLIVFISLIALLNYGLESAGNLLGFSSVWSLQKILGIVFAPFAWLMGVPWAESLQVGAWLGEKLVLNEFVAFIHMAEAADQLSERTLIITSYALCGFANFSSIGIQLGGIGAIAPSKRPLLAELGVRAMIAGNLAAFMTAAWVALLL
jgi:concentrative nucleoside transporter, CNT family